MMAGSLNDTEDAKVAVSHANTVWRQPGDNRFGESLFAGGLWAFCYTQQRTASQAETSNDWTINAANGRGPNNPTKGDRNNG